METVLRTERLLLRPLGPGDLEAVAAYATDPENARLMVFFPHEDAAETAAFLSSAAAEWQKKSPAFLEFAILEEGALIGNIGLYFPEEGCGEFSWLLRRDRWGRGYAPEAARALLDFGRERLGLTRFLAQCDAANAASIRVAEGLGLRLTGRGTRHNRLSPEERPELIYELRL